MAIFLSHSSKDAQFVRLLVRLLDFHGIEYWYSVNNLKGGDRCTPAIEAAVEEAAIMLLVLSESALASKWVLHEITSFRAARPDGRIIPLILSDVDPERLTSLNLNDIQYVRFDECLLTGFESLFRVFDLKFLVPRIVSRAKERRISTVRQRLRQAFWRSLHEATGIGKFEIMELRYTQIAKISSALKSTVTSYVFINREDNRHEDPNALIEATVQEVCHNIGESRAKAIVVAESIAELLWERFEIVPKERRHFSDSGTVLRAGGSD